MRVTNKLAGIITGQICATILAVVGAVSDTAELTTGGVGLLGGLTMYLIGNGNSARNGQTSAPAILPSSKDPE